MVKVWDHIISYVTQFQYPWSIVQNDEEIKGDVINWTNVRWLKWRKVFIILCDTKILLKLKRKFYQAIVRSMILYETKCNTNENVGMSVWWD